ncbi:M48 family metallopeptidase [Sneathiella chinensis]|uniref:YgjP-like metallopeptidase domain-containing protein n=2 Tax=Sneathiella chinensis TaxID=349750 RepID=A0ABQ5TZU0_9PROT|nr:SprT family zinc-dependent metalloprotease [Sneathiella chinensis]GLQ04910.1 hypothetical protein GCM10007924_01310 [Sneathiella chinensis]
MIRVAGREVPVTVQRSSRARKMKIKVGAAQGIVLVLPRSVPLKTGYAFLQEQRDWIAETAAALPTPVVFADGALVPLFGVDHVIRHVPEQRGFVWREAGCLYVAGESSHLPRRVTDWMKKEIRNHITDQAQRYADRLEVRIAGISVRDQTSRWGSCSSARRLNFSWRLIFMPENVCHYVIAHEVAHLRHMNHSQEFWDTVTLLFGDSRQERRWLRENGAGVHRYGG